MKIVEIKDKKGSVRKKFKVIPENGVVVGEAIQNSIYDELEDVCTKQEISCMPSIIYEDGFTDRYLLNRKCSYAKSKCDLRDEWNEKIGIDVVSAKLDLKEHLRKARKLDKTLIIMNSTMRKLEDACQKHKKKAAAIKRDLEEYYGWRKK